MVVELPAAGVGVEELEEDDPGIEEDDPGVEEDDPGVGGLEEDDPGVDTEGEAEDDSCEVETVEELSVVEDILNR